MCAYLCSNGQRTTAYNAQLFHNKNRIPEGSGGKLPAGWAHEQIRQCVSGVALCTRRSGASFRGRWPAKWHHPNRGQHLSSSVSNYRQNHNKPPWVPPHFVQYHDSLFHEENVHYWLTSRFGVGSLLDCPWSGWSKTVWKQQTNFRKSAVTKSSRLQRATVQSWAHPVSYWVSGRSGNSAKYRFSRNPVNWIQLRGLDWISPRHIAGCRLWCHTFHNMHCNIIMNITNHCNKLLPCVVLSMPLYQKSANWNYAALAPTAIAFQQYC